MFIYVIHMNKYIHMYTQTQVINVICLAVYYFEMIVLILASPWNYVLDPSSVFDSIVNLISTVDLIQSYVSGDGGSVGVQVRMRACICVYACILLYSKYNIHS